MRKNIIKSKGESLLETVIAFTLFAVGITISGMIMSTSIRNMHNTKNRIIAANIAREGIEAVRNIRDTNWLKFQSKRRACWNEMPAINPKATCDGSNPIKAGTYIVYKQGGYPSKTVYSIYADPAPPPTYRWLLGQMRDGNVNIDEYANAPIVSNGEFYHNLTNEYTYYGVDGRWISIAELDLVDINPIEDTDGDSDYTNDENIYNHIYVYPKDSSNVPLGDFVKETLFNRIITIEYLDNDGNIISSGTPTAAYNRMRVTSKVTWKLGGKEFAVTLVTHLTDYLGRERLSD